VPFAEHLTNDGREYHGGVIASLVDTTGAAAVWAGHDFDKGMRASTVSMTVNYTGRASGDLLATARCVKRGRDLAFSEIRVEDPQSLAELVLGGESTGRTDERIEAAIGGKERTVFLPRPLPIHIEYFTDFVDEFGELKERPDGYGLIRRVEGILARASQD